MVPGAGMKTASLLATVMAAVGAAPIIDNQTLVPLGLLVGSIATSTVITWRVATAFNNMRRDLEELRKQNRYRRFRGSRQDREERESEGMDADVD